MTEDHLEKFARGYLEGERELIATSRPRQTPLTLKWRDIWRLGGIVELRADGICLVALSTLVLPPEMVDALHRVAPDRLTLTADDALDLTGRQHVVARQGERIVRMSPEQTRWAADHVGLTYEQNGDGWLHPALAPERDA